MIDTLTEIQDRKQKLFGTHLKSLVLDLEQQIFTSKKSISEEDQRLIILGNESIEGLLSLCDNRENFSNKLKKSSIEAFRVLYRLITEFQQKQDFQNIFQEFESEEFVQLNLSIHITKNPDREIGCKFASFIKKQRKFLNIDTFIKSKKAQTIFQDFEEKYNKDSINDIQQQNIDSQLRQSLNSLERPSISSQKIKLRKQFGYLVQRNIPYYIETFYDPIQLLLDEEDNQKKVKKMKKNKLFQVKCEQFPLSNNFSQDEIVKMIDKIHIESPTFDPYILLSYLHTKTQTKQLTKVLEALENKEKKNDEINSDLVFFFIEKYMNMKNEIEDIYQSFQQETSEINELNQQIQGFRQNYQKKTFSLIQNQQVLGDLTKKYNFYKKNERFFNAKKNLLNFYKANDYDSIVTYYKELSPIIKVFTQQNLFLQDIEQILNMIKSIKESLLRHMDLNQKKFEKINHFIMKYISLSSNEDTQPFFLQDSFKDQILKYIEDSFQRKISKFDQKIHVFEISLEQDDGDNLNEFSNYLDFKQDNFYDLKAFQEFSSLFLQKIKNFQFFNQKLASGLYYNFRQSSQDQDEITENQQLQVQVKFDLIFVKLKYFYLDLIQKIFKNNQKIQQSYTNKMIEIQNVSKSMNQIKQFILKQIYLKRHNLFTEHIYEIENHFIIQQMNFIENHVKNTIIPVLKIEDQDGYKCNFNQNPSQNDQYVFNEIEKIILQIKDNSFFDEFTQNQLDYLHKIYQEIIQNWVAHLYQLSKTQPNSQLIILNYLSEMIQYQIKNHIESVLSKIPINYQIDLQDFLQEVTENSNQKVVKTYNLLLISIQKIKLQPLIEQFVLAIGYNFPMIKERKYLYEIFQDKDKVKNFENHLLTEQNIKKLQIQQIKNQEKWQIRNYIFWVIQELVYIIHELLTQAQNLSDDFMKKLILELNLTIYIMFKNTSHVQEQQQLKQIWVELEFFQQVVVRFQTEESREKYEGIFTQIKRIYFQNKQEYEKMSIFDEQEIQEKKKAIRNNIYKSQLNFSCL